MNNNIKSATDQLPDDNHYNSDLLLISVTDNIIRH